MRDKSRMNTKWEHLKMTTYLRFCQRLCTASQVLVQTKDHRLWLVCMCVWTESKGRRISRSLKFNRQIVLRPPCTGQSKSDWPPSKHKSRSKETTWRSGCENGEGTTGKLRSCRDSEPFSAELDRFACYYKAQGCCRTPIIGR